MESLVLNKDNVKLKVKASDWEEAVRIGAGMLVEQGCAKQSYVDGIIASVKELGLILSLQMESQCRTQDQNRELLGSVVSDHTGSASKI